MDEICFIQDEFGFLNEFDPENFRSVFLIKYNMVFVLFKKRLLNGNVTTGISENIVRRPPYIFGYKAVNGNMAVA